jgi:hypothetical protein
MKTPKSVVSDDRRRRLETQANALSNHCPVDRSNPDTCPLCDLRRFGVRARRAWLHRLSLDELQYLVLYHAGCAGEKKRVLARQPSPRPVARARSTQPAANAG